MKKTLKITQNDKAIEAFIKTLNTIRKSNLKNTKEKEARLLNNIGAVLHEEEQFSEAIVYYKKALVLLKDNKFKAITLYNIALIYAKRFKQFQEVRVGDAPG